MTARPHSPSQKNTLAWWLLVLPFLCSGFLPLVGGQSAFFVTTNTTVLSVSRAYLASTTVGSLVLFAGGTTNGSSAGVTATVDIFNASNNTWTTALLSQARAYLAATTVGSLALFAGGRRSDGSSSDVVDIFNAANNSWTTTSLSQPRAWLAATSVGSLALFGGGLLTSAVSSASALVDVYNAANNSWTTAQLKSARSNLAATSVGSLAIFAFGRNNTGVAALSGAVDIYNATDDSWQNTTLTWARHNLPAFTVGNLAFFPGGRSTGSFYRADMYNATDNMWSGSSFSQARDTSAAAAVGSVGILAGGTVYGETTAYANVDLYVASNGSWIPTTPLTQGRWGLAGAAVGNVALFAGGLTKSTSASAVVDIYNFTFLPMPDRVPTLQFNNSSDVLLIPKDNQGSVRPAEAVGLDFGGTVKELDAQDSSEWVSVAPEAEINATESFLFSTNLTFADAVVATNKTARAEVQFYLFRERTAISIGDDLTLYAEPSFAKFSVRLFDWPWQGAGNNNTLEMRIKIAPAFTNFSRRANPGSELVTSLILAGQFNALVETEVRLVGAVEVDGEVGPQQARFDMDVTTSELVLTFPRFNSTLVYDPDVGVLFGQQQQGDQGGGGDDVGLIVGVTVACAVAVAVVVAVVVGVSVALTWRRHRRTQAFRSRASQVNYDL